MITARPSWAPIPLRLILAIGYIYHGLPKLASMAGHDMFAGMLTGMGIPLPGVMAWVVGALEVFGGLALLLGLFVTWTAILLLVEMVVALLMVHLPNGFNAIHITGMSDQGPVFGMPGAEFTLLYISALLSLLLSGPGALRLGAKQDG
jgi:putative oxidoreductase